MLRLIRSGIALLGVLAIGVFSIQLPTWSERVILGGGSVVIFIIIVTVFFERIRRLIEGYYTYMSGGVEDGDLIYKEGSRTLRFYFKRRSHTIYIPTDKKWLEVMPEWAKQKRAPVVERVKSQIGKHWSVEDTEEPERILSQA